MPGEYARLGEPMPVGDEGEASAMDDRVGGGGSSSSYGLVRSGRDSTALVATDVRGS